jgi:phosphatidylglycerophosphatase A
MPRAPGTWGSLVGLPLAWSVGQLPPTWQGVAAVLLFLIGIPICERGARLLRAKDPGAVVFDEMAAFPVIFLFISFQPATAIAAFLLFRLFDISKPWPCRQFERLPGGLGIMADDLVAGLYTGAVLWSVARWLPLG